MFVPGLARTPAEHTEAFEDRLRYEVVTGGDDESHTGAVDCQSSSPCPQDPKNVHLNSAVSKVDSIQPPHKLCK